MSVEAPHSWQTHCCSAGLQTGCRVGLQTRTRPRFDSAGPTASFFPCSPVPCLIQIALAMALQSQPLSSAVRKPRSARRTESRATRIRREPCETLPYPRPSRPRPPRPAIACTGTRIVATVGIESGRAASPACTATTASTVSFICARTSAHHFRSFPAHRRRNRILRHAVEERFNAIRPRPRNGLHALGQVCLRIRLRFRTHEDHAAHSLRRSPPQLQQHVASDGASAKNRFRNF